MKKDISFAPVRGVQVAIAKHKNEINQDEWRVYLLNRNPVPITNVFVTSKGYSEKGENQQRTSTLRHYFADLEPGAHALVEPIMPDVFHLNNEYWVSYFIDNQVFDKKFIFVPDSITEQNLIEISPLGMQGILHE